MHVTTLSTIHPVADQSRDLSFVANAHLSLADDVSSHFYQLLWLRPIAQSLLVNASQTLVHIFVTWTTVNRIWPALPTHIRGAFSRCKMWLLERQDATKWRRYRAGCSGCLYGSGRNSKLSRCSLQSTARQSVTHYVTFTQCRWWQPFKREQ